MLDATSLLRTYAQITSARGDGRSFTRLQERLLLRLVGRGAGTRFGEAHGFTSIRNVSDYQHRTPLRSYTGTPLVHTCRRSSSNSRQ